MKFLKVSLISLLLSLMPTIAFPNIGDLDVTFGIGGIVTHGGIVEAVAIQPDGKILLTGESNNGANLDLFVARLNSDGILDTTFSNNGVFMYDVGDDYGCAIALQKDGKIVVAGGSSLSGIYDVLVLRLNADGTVDNTFGSEGIVLERRRGESLTTKN